MNRVFAIIFMSLVLSGCGFKPVHSQSAFGGQGLSGVSVISEGNQKEDFLLKQALRDRMGSNTNTAYILHTKSKLNRGALGISAQDVAARYDLTLVVNLELRDAKTGDVLFKDKISTTSSFAASNDPYASASSQSNAAQKIAAEAADRIILRLARYHARK